MPLFDSTGEKGARKICIVSVSLLNWGCARVNYSGFELVGKFEDVKTVMLLFIASVPFSSSLRIGEASGQPRCQHKSKL
jgi:hypothetical protein